MMTGIPGCGVVKVLPMDFNVRFICTRNAREPLHETPLRRARGTHRGRRRAMLANPSTAKRAGSLDPNRVRTGLRAALGARRPIETFESSRRDLRIVCAPQALRGQFLAVWAFTLDTYPC
jgi:hypothetical protein